MTTPIPPQAVMRRPLRNIAFWQAMSFVMLICAMWAGETLGLLHEGPPDPARMVLPTVLIALGGVIAVAHTYIQEERALRGMITICAYCHKVMTKEDVWMRIEKFVTEHSGADFSHGACPDCFKRLMDELNDNRDKKTSMVDGCPGQLSKTGTDVWSRKGSEE
jgi:hypothetical protein